MPKANEIHARPLVLVVDDDRLIRLFVRATLEQAGFRVEEAADGSQALALFPCIHPDLVLLDVTMPGMDGFSVCTTLRQMPQGTHTPILMLTGLEDEASVNRAYEVGATDFTTKPINTALLGHRVRYLLRASCAITALRQSEQALRQEAQISTTLVQVGRELSASLATPVILERLCQITSTVLECDGSYTLLQQSEEEAYVAVAGWGIGPQQWAEMQALRIPREVLISLLDNLTREEAIVQDNANASQSLPLALTRSLSFTSFMCLGLRRGSEIIGLQVVGSRGQPHSFTPQHRRIARGIAQFAALALENARLLEQAENANRLKSDFLATVSHELRTPLHIIIGYKDMLLDAACGPLTSKQRDMLHRLELSAARLLKLITTTLDVGRLEARRIPLELREIDVAALLAEVKTETQSFCQQTSLDFSWEIASNLPLLISDPVKLKVMLKNLIENAVKFTQVGSVTVAARSQKGGVELQVTDTGPGITPDVLPHIFEAFHQGENPLTRRHEGAGLGLYLVRRLLDLLGGTITVDSIPGRGSTFRVWIPVTVATGSTATRAN